MKAGSSERTPLNDNPETRPDTQLRLSHHAVARYRCAFGLALLIVTLFSAM